VADPQRDHRKVMDTYKARELMRMIADGTWVSADRALQFDTTVNDWHTSPNTARINASNPCSEYMFLDDSACNLASINLMKFVGENGELDFKAFEKACQTFITAQEILVDNASYPTPAIAATATTTVRSASGTPTWARCSCRAGCRTTATPDATTRDDYRHHARRGLCAIGAGGARSRRTVSRIREEPRTDDARDAETPRGPQGHQQDARPKDMYERGERDLG